VIVVASKSKMLEGELIKNRVVIWEASAVGLYDESGYGKPMPDEKPKRLELELAEAVYLLEKEKIKVFVKQKSRKKALKFKDLFNLASKDIDGFAAQYAVYKDLRTRGYLVKTGFKFGTHFRVYDRGVKLRRGPKAPHEHTKWIVHAVAEESAFSLPELSRAVRLAHNIRATMLWAVVDKESDVTYYLLQRITP
jgi:tRNA-intron endonuclease